MIYTYDLFKFVDNILIYHLFFRRSDKSMRLNYKAKYIGQL